MEYGLASVFLAVENKAGAGLFETQFLGNALCLEKHFAHQFAVFCLHFHKAGNVLLGNDQEVDRSLGGDVVEGEDIIVFVDFLGGNFTLDNFTEKTVFTHSDEKIQNNSSVFLFFAFFSLILAIMGS